MSTSTYRSILLCAFLAFHIVLSTTFAAGKVDERALIELARAAVTAEVEGKQPPAPGRKSPVRPVFITILPLSTPRPNSNGHHPQPCIAIT